MSTLLLRLAGPMQAWGTSSKFGTRYTNREPSKSGVIGMIAAAMGRGRDESIEDLKSLRFGVRIDQDGGILRDFHTVHHPDVEKLAFVTDRYYLSDAIFLVGVEGERGHLEEIEQAVRNPVFPLFLGRRSCPPTGRISLGIRDTTLMEALRSEDWQASTWYRRNMPQTLSLEIVCDAEGSEDGILERDAPESFSQKHRMHNSRRVVHMMEGVHITNTCGKKISRTVETEHDAIMQLRGV